DAGSGGVEDAFVDHLPGPVIAFLPRSEHEYDVAGQVLADSVEQREGADEAGSVQVVAAGVHLPRGRGEVESGRLGHGQSVHIPTQEHGRHDYGHGVHTGTAAQHHDDRGQPLTRAHFDIEALDGLEDELLRHRQVEADLDVLMQGPAEGDESGGDVRGVFGGGQVDGGGLGGGCWVVGK